MEISNTKIGGVSPNEVPKKYPISRLSMIFGILSLCLLPIFAVPGLITGFIAKAKEKGAKKFYTVGIITSCISIVLAILVMLLVKLLLNVLGLDFSDFSSIESIRNIDLEPIFEKLARPFI